MNKNLGTQTVTTTNFVTLKGETGAASHTWTEAEMVGMWYTLDLQMTAWREDNLDGNGYKVKVEVFEYTFPGLYVIALVENGEVLTVFDVANVTVMKLAKAIRRQHPVTIGYTKQYDGEDTVRTVEPTSLRITKDGNVIMGGRDRRSGAYRSFRVDMIADYTVHRTAFVVDDARAELITQLRETRKIADAAADGRYVQDFRNGQTGIVDPESRSFSASGWSVVMRLTGKHRNATPSGTVRVNEDHLVRITPADVAFAAECRRRNNLALVFQS